MSNQGKQDPVEVLKEAFKIVDQRDKQLREFLQGNKPIYISNEQYMEAYSIVLKASDCGADPVTQEQKKDTQMGQDIEDQLFEKFKSLFKTYLENDYKIVSQIEEPNAYIEKIRLQFKNFKLYLHWLWKVFQYLDRFYLKNKDSTLQIQGFKFYKEYYWDKISSKVFQTVLDFQFNQLREGNQIDKPTIQTLISIFSFIGFNKKLVIERNENSGSEYTHRIKNNNDNDIFIIFTNFEECKDYYSKNFEKEFAEELEKFYKKKVEVWKNLSTPEYVSEVLKSLENERQIAQYFYPRSELEMIQIIEQITIIQNAEQIANHSTGVLYMLQNKKISQLTDIYQLFSYSERVRSTLKFIANKFQEYLTTHGKSYQADADAAKAEKKNQKDIALDYIQKVLGLRKVSEDLMKTVFNNDLVLQTARDKAFQTFLNDYEKATFYLALHSDNLLKSDNFNNEQEVEEQLDNILKIFFSLFARDTFFKHYQKFFSNRLLNSTSKNQNAEKDLIAKFKAEAGQTAVSKIVTMLQDITQSNEMMDQHAETLKSFGGFQLSVNVLTQGCWPIAVPPKEEKSTTKIPQALNNSLEKFKQIYQQKHAGRHLTWLFSQGTAEIIFKACDDKDKNKPSRYTLQANSYQLLTLLHLDENNGTLSFSQVLQFTNFPREEIDFCIQALVKNKILKREQKEGKFSDNEKLTINTEYSNKSRKVKIIPGGKAEKNKQDKETVANQERWNKEIEQERECVVDACIVRIMKGKRQLNFNELVPECISLITNFKADIGMIKRRIESLIDRDYLRRDKSDIKKLNYVP